MGFIMILLMIQPPKVPKISEAMMRMMGLGLLEKAIQLTNHLKFLTSLLVSHHRSSLYYNLQVLNVLFILGRESNEIKVWLLNYFSMITNLICSRYIIEIFPFCISLIGILKNKIKSLYCASCTIALPFGFHIATFFLSFF